MEREPNITIPTRLFKNLIDCLDAQRTLSNSNIDVVSRNQIQTLIDNTKNWAKEILQSKGETIQTATDLQETLDFVKSDNIIKKDPLSSCDIETDSDLCQLSVVEPDDPFEKFM
jgi:hypothetical protein